MILHLFPKTQFTEDYILFIQNHFDFREHEFILYSNEPFKLNDEVYDLDNVYDYDLKDIIWLYRQLRNADIIVLHNLGLMFKELLVFAADKRIIRKSAWMIWGADLYCYRNPRNGIGEHIVEAARRRIARHIRYTATLTDGDYELLSKWYKCSPKNYRLEYMSERAVNQMKGKLTEERTKGPIRILLGNSATRSNCHIEAFHMLAKYKDEDIQIITPLSYGDMEYAEEVMSEGRMLFGDKFVPMTEFIPKDKYYDFLYSIDIGIFNNDRQEATGNIQALMYYRRKVFIRHDTSMWTEWNEKEGYSLEDISNIAKLDYEAFVGVNEASVKKNYNKVYAYYDADARSAEWQELFDAMSNQE